MLFSTIVQEMLSAFGCFTLTIILVVVGVVLLAAKLGFAPAVAKLLTRPRSPTNGTDLD